MHEQAWGLACLVMSRLLVSAEIDCRHRILVQRFEFLWRTMGNALQEYNSSLHDSCVSPQKKFVFAYWSGGSQLHFLISYSKLPPSSTI